MNRLLVGLLCACASSAWAVESFVLEPTHTFPSFEIRHQSVSVMRGKFTRTQGRVVLDPEGQGSRIEVSVDAGSGDTGHAGLNQKLLGSSFFNSGQFPEIRFVATDVVFKDGKPVAANGNLTLLGVTRPVTLEIRDYACTRQFLTLRPLCGADVHTSIKRSDFGMTWGIPLIGDEVKLAIEVEALRE
jgi:polyisoprenoid-binding protein YceI